MMPVISAFLIVIHPDKNNIKETYKKVAFLGKLYKILTFKS